MKKAIRLICFCLGAALVLTGCGSKGDYAIKVGDRTVTENDYYRAMLTACSNHLASDSGAENTKEYWKSETDSGATLSETLTQVVTDHLIETMLYAVQFDKLGLSFTQSEEDTIQSTLSETIESIGGMSAFNAQLASSHYTYEEYLEEVYDSAKKSKVLSYYYGSDGKEPVDLQDIKDYYNVHHALVKMVYILKVDKETGEPLTEAQLRETRQKADDAYAAALRTGDTDNFADVIALFSAYPGETDSMVIDERNTEEKMLGEILALEVGEVTKVETDDCYFIIKRYDGTADDVFTATVMQSTLEEIRAQEIGTMLAECQENTKIKINKKVTKKYMPEKLI